MLTIVVTALNEESHLESAVENIRRAASACAITPYEIIIINDGSTDRTPETAARLEANDPCIRAIQLSTNHGPGYGFKKGLELAQYSRITVLPGDDSIPYSSLEALFQASHQAPMVISFISNPEKRPGFRQWLSAIHHGLYAFIFKLPIRYINGSSIYPVELARAVKIHSDLFAFSAELTTKVLHKGVVYKEIGFPISENQTRSSALRIKVLSDVIATFALLFVDIYFLNRNQYGEISKSRSAEFA